MKRWLAAMVVVLALVVPVLALVAVVALASPSPTWALDVNATAVKGLSQAYGFIIGQEYMLDRISKKYPDLASSAELARARFASTFPNIKTRLEFELRSALGPANVDQLAKKIAGAMHTTLDRQTVTPDSAAKFLDQVQGRARGEIESPMLEYLLAVKYANDPAREYSDGFRQRFDTDGTGKAGGIKLSLRLPRSWAALDGERPHIVKKWTTEGGTGREILMLDIRDAEGYDPDKREIERFLRSGEVKQAVPDGAVYLASGPFTVEGRPGYWIDWKLTQERVGVVVYQRMLMYQLFFRGRAIGIMCQAGGPPGDAAKVDASLTRFRPLCQQVVNSLVLHQAY